MASSSQVAAHEYWGYLIRPDKSPSPVFEQLLLGVANYINWHIAPWDVNSLTPAKLAHFYRLVGGDYDSLFLDTADSSLSFIYQSLGCYHTLQPESNPYNPPSTPALTPQGFVRWQTVQLLLEPEEHVPFLQNAVKRFEIMNPVDGAPFPSILPREVLPTIPDPDMVEWHSSVSEKLMLEAQASADKNLPPRPQMALSDIDAASSRDSSVDTHSVASSSMAGYFAGPRLNHTRSFPENFPHHAPRSAYEAPWSPERRRSSFSDAHANAHSSIWHKEPPTPRSSQPGAPPNPPRPTHHHIRTPSDLSTISTSTSDSSISTTSSASLSPARYATHLPPPMSPGNGTRRHPAHLPPQLPRPKSHPQQSVMQGRLRSEDGTGERRKNVRWQDMDDVFDGPRFSPPAHRDGRERSGSGGGGGGGGRGWDERGRGRSGNGNVNGGRRMPAGSGWR
ncbi:hypothetical protein MMC21_000606 [Puttea exsequens]|nr:hypothetical protein [Puttea exsequens]